MKKQIKLFLAIPALSGFLFLSCNSDSDKTSSTTDSSSTTMTKTDTGMSKMTTDTSKMNSTKSTTAGKKKGKVSTMMMTTPEKTTASMNADKEGYYSSVETLPMYPGGQAALDQFINDNVEYPQQAIDNNKEGTVVVSFGIDENGKVINAKTTGAALGNGLEEEALKVINKMPAWTPGMVKGKKVKSHYNLPIRFQLAE